MGYRRTHRKPPFILCFTLLLAFSLATPSRGAGGDGVAALAAADLDRDGVYVGSGEFDNAGATMIGNLIGVAADGKTALHNGGNGIRFSPGSGGVGDEDLA
jgi:hypothetical protein